MALTPVEIIATIFIVLAAIKIIVILVNRMGWYNSVVKPVYSSSLSPIIFLILAAIVFWYIIQEVTIVQIIAVSAFVGLLIGVGFAAFGKDTLQFSKKVYAKELNGWTWISLLIWTALILWAAYMIFIV